MSVELRLPDIGEGMQEGEIVKWLVQEGEWVTEDQPVVEVQTDKVVAEIPAPASGVIDKIFADAGAVVPVNEVILRISVEGVSGQSERGQNERDSKSNRVNGQRALAAPATRRLARKLEVDIEQITGSGPGGRVLEEDVRRAAARLRTANGCDTSGQPVELADGISETAGNNGHGVSGRNAAANIVSADQSRHAASDTYGVTGNTSCQGGLADDLMQSPNPSQYGETTPDEKFDFTGLRGVIAKNMVQSAFTIPHVTHFDEADVTGLIRMRERVREKVAAHGVKLTYLPFFMKAIVVALQEFPVFNATWSEDGKDVWLRKTYNIGVAVDTEDGLVVPVVRNVNRKSIVSISREIEALADKARNRRLSSDELKGGTFTVSNVGSVGGLFATPIIRYPEVALMAFHQVKARPVAIEENEERKVVVRDMMNVSVSFDHRIADGVAVVHFTNRILELIESPEQLLIALP